MLLSADKRQTPASRVPLKNTRHRPWRCPTHVQELVQLFPAELHLLVCAELGSAEAQDVADLLLDHLQGLRVEQQVVQGPEGGGDRVGHGRPEDGEVMP